MGENSLPLWARLTQRLVVGVALFDKPIRGPRWRSLIRRLYNWMAPVYDRGARALMPDYQRMAVRLLEALEVSSTDRLLDLGCGTGMVTLPALERAAWAVGIDLTPGMLRQLRGKSPEMPLVNGDVTHLPFAPRTFDVVTTSFMLVHLTEIEKQAVFHGVQRALRSGGRFGCLTGQEGSTHAYPTASEWRAWLGESGFQDVQVIDPDSVYRLVTARLTFTGGGLW